MPIKLNSAGGGSVTINAASTAAAAVLTVPATNANIVTTGDSNTITQSMMSTGFYGGYGPAFYAYQSVAQTFSATTSTKINLQTKLFDTNSAFNTTNYRFQPTVAGYYQFTGSFYFTLTGNAQISLYKNGSTYLNGQYITATGLAVSGLMYLNGSTDYAELWMYSFAGFTSNQLNSTATTFQAFLARPA